MKINLKRILILVLCMTMVFNSQCISILAEESVTSEYLEDEGTNEENVTESTEVSESSINEAEDESADESASESEVITDDESVTELASESEESSEELNLEAGSMTFDEWEAGFESGNGSESSPFVIMSVSQLEFFNKNFKAYTYAKSCYYRLKTNIDYKGKEWIPITETVEGFDGDSYIIRNMTIVADDDMARTSCIAMFRDVKHIKDVKIINAEIIDRRTMLQSTDSINYAVLCGDMSEKSVMEKCNIDGDIKLTVESDSFRINSLSGFVAVNRGKIDNCYLEAVIKYDSNVSGIVYENCGIINECKNLGKICSLNGNGTYSGIACRNDKGAEITACRNEKSITVAGDSSIVAGIVGSTNSGIITGCYNKGNLSGNTVAGIAGRLEGGTIKKCHNNADISGESVSGIVDMAFCGEITECDNSGSVQGTKASGCIQEHSSSDSIELNVSKCTNSGEVIGKEKAAGFITSVDTSKYSKSKLKMTSCVNEGVVSNAEDSNISSAAAGIVCEAYSRTLEPDNIVFKKCSNAGIVSSNGYASGVAYYAYGNVTIEECSNEGEISGREASGIAWKCFPLQFEDEDDEEVAASPTILRCYNTGAVSAIWGSYVPAAGIVCELTSGNVSACYNSGTISGTNNVAGIASEVGNYMMDSTISDCYNSGDIVNIAENIYSGPCGGIVGNLSCYGDGIITVTNCYNVGKVYFKNVDKNDSGQLFGNLGLTNDTKSLCDISGCYYSRELGTCAGMDYSGEDWFADVKAYGVTTADMKQQSTYDGYDFSSTWSMGDEEYPYPILSCIGAGDSFRIIYILADGKNNPKNASRFYQGDTITLYDPTREGFVFGGWFTDAGYTEPITEISGEVRKNVTVFAKWIKGDDTLDDVTINGSGYAFLSGTLYSEKGDRLCDTLYSWTLYNTKGDKFLDTDIEVAKGSGYSDSKGRYSVKTPEVSTTNKYAAESHYYRIVFKVTDGDGSRQLPYSVYATVKVSPFTYKQSWDLGSNLSAELSGDWGIRTEEIGDATLEKALGGIGVSGDMGRHLQVEKESAGLKENVTIKEAYSSKVGGKLSFGPKYALKKGEDAINKGSFPLSVSGGISYGSTITPGLTIEDYDPGNPDDKFTLGAFVAQSNGMLTGNILLVEYVARAANTLDLDYSSFVEHNNTIALKAGSKIKNATGSGSYSVDAASSYSYTESAKYYDANGSSKTTSYKVDKNVKSTSKVKLAGISEEVTGSIGEGDSFAISTNNTPDIEWLSFTLSDTNSSKFSFVVNGEKNSTKKTTIKYKDD